MRNQFLFLVFASLASRPASAVDWDQCRFQFADAAGFREFSLFTTTTTGGAQVTSSFGPCAYNAKPEPVIDKRREFITANLNAIKEETAKASGEHLDALAELYKCRRIIRPQFFEMMQKEFSSIFEDENAGLIQTRIASKIYMNDELKQHCYF